MTIEQVVNTTVTISSAAGLEKTGFGVPLIAAYTTVFGERYREYTSLTAMTDDGFTTADPAYGAASKIFAQNPRPPKVLIGRRANAYTQQIKLTPATQGENYVHSVAVETVDGTTETATYTESSGDAVGDITAGLQTALAALSAAITATDNTTDVTVDADNTGDLFGYTVTDSIKIEDVTADPGLAADLAAIRAATTDWYGLALDCCSPAEAKVATNWAESNDVLFIAHVFDANEYDSGSSTDAMADAQTNAYARSAVLYAPSAVDFAGAAWLGERLPSTPGTSTWAHKTLAGVATDANIKSGEYTAISDKNGNAYRTIAGKNITLFGTTGSGEFIDITRLADWIEARIEEEVFALLISNEKVPFTDEGAAMIRGAIERPLLQGVVNGALTPDFTITIPTIASLSAADKAARNLSGITVTCTATGAVHTVLNITVTLNATL